MIYFVSLALRASYKFFNIFHYVSFRMVAALLTALFLFFVFGSWFIKNSRLWFSAKAREYTPESHKAKDGIPTMGGLLMVPIVLLTTLLWCNWLKPEVLLFMGCLLGYGAIGFWDDWYKIRYKKGIAERHKFVAQLIVGGVIISLWIWLSHPATTLSIPFIKHVAPALGFFFIPWGIVLLVGTSNAVNLSDGLDGLAIGSLIANFGLYTGLLYVSGHNSLAQYLHIPFTGSSEIAIIGAALVGVSLGFLWYNAHPAEIFMGDVGSLSLGAALALMALMSKQELLLPLTGVVFVAETISVILQVFSYKWRGKRLFKMAPIHHHFELLGWPEEKITVRFTIVTIIACLFAAMTLKIR